MFENIYNLLPKALRQKGVYDGVEAARLLQRAKEYYQLYTKIEVAPLKFQKNILYIQVPSSAASQECRRYMEGCIEALSQEGYDVHKITFRLP